jgi:hypothetical protein
MEKVEFTLPSGKLGSSKDTNNQNLGGGSTKAVTVLEPIVNLGSSPSPAPLKETPKTTPRK